MVLSLLSQLHEIVSVPDPLLDKLYFRFFFLAIHQLFPHMAFSILQVLDPLRIGINRLGISLYVSLSHNTVGHVNRPVQPLILHTRIDSAVVVPHPADKCSSVFLLLLFFSDYRLVHVLDLV